MYLAGIVIAGRRDRRRARGAQRRASNRSAAPSPMCCTKARRGLLIYSDRRARDPARQGRALCRGEAARWSAAASSASSASRSPAPSAATSISSMRWRSASFPIAISPRSASAGNAAGTGARIALLNLAARAEIESVVRRIEKIETAIEPDFQAPFRRRDGDSQQGGRLPQSGRSDRAPSAQGVERRGWAQTKARRSCGAALARSAAPTGRR